MDIYDEISKLRKRFHKLVEENNLYDAMSVGDYIIYKYKQNNMSKSMRYADDLFAIAYVYDEAGDLSRAIRLYMESMTIVKRLKGKNADYALRANNMATVFSRKMVYNEALKLYRDVYEISLRLYGENSRQGIDAIYNLGNALFDSGDYENALRQLKKALSLRSEKDKDYADNLNSIAYVYEAVGNNEGAIQYLSRALLLIKNIEGKASHEYLSNLYYLGMFNIKTQQYSNALDCFQIFMDISAEVIDSAHPYCVMCMNEISEIHRIQGNIDEAINAKIRLLALAEKSIGRNHIYVANVMVSIALLYKNRKNFKKAIFYTSEALNIKRGLIGENNVGYIKDFILLSSFYFEDRQFTKTIEMTSSIMSLLEDNEYLFSEDMTSLAKIYLHTDRVDFNFDMEPFLNYDIESLEKLLHEIYKSIDDNMVE
ncbi:tetratricopeptide repeat protein [Anaeropeptidivorans aminofermentans]|uniref:tetratricopeptide repeat protein n=1 Tax=Anaeropeptidivorans aminofermentans TaxID=2934315 RepID=UPI002024D4E9|nr:tetratricopeptide repeat protein [Anaeropeptidivorans aminofermentans]MBE6012936.1 tetratricopeptide repeat protein [Lachnospiraceae bacterium]